MNPDGTGLTALTNSASVNAGPVYSPDGTKITFFSNRDGNDEVYVMNADGSGQTRLTVSTGTDVRPDWQRVLVTTPDPVTPPVTPPPPDPGTAASTGSGSGIRLASASGVVALSNVSSTDSLPEAGGSPLLPILTFGLLAAAFYRHRQRPLLQY